MVDALGHSLERRAGAAGHVMASVSFGYVDSLCKMIEEKNYEVRQEERRRGVSRPGGGVPRGPRNQAHTVAETKDVGKKLKGQPGGGLCQDPGETERSRGAG
jgi:hypothetical protein